MNLTCQTVWHTQPSGKMPLTLYVKEQVLSRNTWQEIGRTLFNRSDQQTIWLTYWERPSPVEQVCKSLDELMDEKRKAFGDIICSPFSEDIYAHLHMYHACSCKQFLIRSSKPLWFGHRCVPVFTSKTTCMYMITFHVKVTYEHGHTFR